MKLHCSSCQKLVADIELAKVSKNIVCYCKDCDNSRDAMIKRLEVLMRMNVSDKNYYNKDSFKDIFGDLWK